MTIDDVVGETTWLGRRGWDDVVGTTWLEAKSRVYIVSRGN